MANQMDQYLRTLDFVNQSSGDKSVRQDERPLDIRLRVGQVYAVRATDNPDYYFTVTIQPNPYSGGFRKVVSQFPVYGDPPPGMDVVSQEQVFKQFRELNGDGAGTTYQAFPYRGAVGPSQTSTGTDVVTPLHKQQLRRN